MIGYWLRADWGRPLNRPSKCAGGPRAALKNIRAALESLIRPRFFADLYTPKYSDAFGLKDIIGAPFISKYSIIGLLSGGQPPDKYKK